MALVLRAIDYCMKEMYVMCTSKSNFNSSSVCSADRTGLHRFTSSEPSLSVCFLFVVWRIRRLFEFLDNF